LPSGNIEGHASKGDRENMVTETKGCVLDKYTSVEGPILIYAALLWWKKASQISVIIRSMHSSPTAALELHIDVATS
jgi:hypothetical protein